MIYVPNIGPKDAKIFIVGEAPGANEEKQLAPFVGHSGQLLRSELIRVGIDPDKTRICNVCHYRPPGNDINKFIKRSKRKDKTTGKRVEKLIPNSLVLNGIFELYRELARAKPNIIVPLGNTALWALTGHETISRRRGSIYTVQPNLQLLNLYSGAQQIELIDYLKEIINTKIVPTFHPAYVSRVMEMLPIFRLDLRRIVEEARTREVNLPQREILIDPPETQAREYVKELLSSPEYSVDIETPGAQLFCIAYSHHPNKALVLRTDTLWKMELHRALLTSSAKKIFQNGVFDCSFLLKNHAITVTNYGYDFDKDAILGWDSMYAQHCIYPEWRVGLDFLCSIYTREPYYKDEGKGHDLNEFEDVETYLAYCGKDACTTLEVSIAQRKREFKDPAFLETLRYVMSQIPWVVEIMALGIKLDVGELRKLDDESRAKSKELQDQLDVEIIQECVTIAQTSKDPKRVAAAIKLAEKIAKSLASVNKAGTYVGGFNVKSPIDVPTYLYDIRGFKKVYKARKGDFDEDKESVTADEETLKEMYGNTGDEKLLKIVTIRKERKLQESYFSVKYDYRGQTFFSINPVGTWSRRWSESSTIDGYGFNAQTPPQRIRTIFIPEYEDMVILYCDLAQAEDRIVAYYANVAKKIYAFENNLDAHCLTGSLIFKVEYATLVKDAKEFKNRTGKEHPQRYLGKQSNHAFNYGEGPQRFMKAVNKRFDETGVRVALNQSKEIRRGHLSAYPEILYYWQDVEAQLRSARTLQGLRIGGAKYGPKWRFSGRFDDATFRKAYSTIPQAVPPEICNRAAAKIRRTLLPRIGDSRVRILNQIHDALLLQIPLDGAEQIGEEVAKAMRIPVEIHGKEIIIPTDYSFGPNWKAAA